MVRKKVVLHMAFLRKLLYDVLYKSAKTSHRIQETKDLTYDRSNGSLKMIFPEQPWGRPKAQSVHTETGRKRARTDHLLYTCRKVPG